MVEQLRLGLIIAAALADSINPCVFGVLIFLIGYMMVVFKKKERMLLAGLIYITAVYVTYFLLGMGLFTFAHRTGLSVPFYWIAATIAILAGLVEIKDFFWYGRWFSLQIIPSASKRIKRYASLLKETERKHPLVSLVVAGLLGVFVVFVELPCTGAPYLVILGLLSVGEYSAGVPLLLLYNFIFILPLFVIIGIAYFSSTSDKLEKWRKKHRGLMRLGTGLLLLALGSYMIWAII